MEREIPSPNVVTVLQYSSNKVKRKYKKRKEHNFREINENSEVKLLQKKCVIWSRETIKLADFFFIMNIVSLVSKSPEPKENVI